MICTSEDNQPKGTNLSEIPVSQGMKDRGSIWLKGAALKADRRAIATEKAFEGHIRVTLEREYDRGKDL